MKYILLLKYKKALRELAGMPYLLWGFLAVLFVGIVYILYGQFRITPNAYIIWGLFFLILLKIHRSRKDKRFVSLLIPHPSGLFIIEYLLLSIPFIIFAVLSANFLLILLYIISPVIIGILPDSYKTSHLKNPFIPLISDSCEWISGLRKYTLLIISLLLLALVVSFVPVISLIVLFLIILLCSEFFLESEPLQLLFLPEKPAGSFLWMKVNVAMTSYVKMILPVLVLYAVLNLKTAWLILVLLIYAYLGFMLFIFVKYSLYNANNTRLTMPLTAAVGMVGFIVPVFLPATIILIINYYFSAKENLNRYLHVYH